MLWLSREADLIYRLQFCASQENADVTNWNFELHTFQVHGPFHGTLDKFARISQRQFFFNVGLVGFNRLGADVQLISDLASPVAGSNQSVNLKFPVAQLRKRVAWQDGAVYQLL